MCYCHNGNWINLIRYRNTSIVCPASYQYVSLRVQTVPVQKRILISWTGLAYAAPMTKYFPLVFQLLSMRYPFPVRVFFVGYTSGIAYWFIFLKRHDQAIPTIPCRKKIARWVCLNVNVQTNRPAYSSINSGHDLANNYKYYIKGHLHKYTWLIIIIHQCMCGLAGEIFWSSSSINITPRFHTNICLFIVYPIRLQVIVFGRLNSNPDLHKFTDTVTLFMSIYVFI